MADDWKYGDVLRRAVTLNPMEFRHVMFIGPSAIGDHRMTAVALDYSDNAVTRDDRCSNKWIREYFEKAPDDE